MKVISKLLKLILQVNKLDVTIIILFNIVLGLLPIYSVYVIQKIIDSLISRKSFSEIIMLFIIYVSIKMIINFIASIVQYLTGKVSNYLTYSFELQVLQKTNQLSLTSFEEDKTYSEIDKLIQEAPTKPFELFSDINSIVVSVVTMFSGLIYLSTITFWLPMIMITISLISIPMLLSLSKEQFNMHWNRAEPERKVWYIKYLLTHDFSVKEVKFLQLFSYLISKYKSLKKDFINQDLKILKKMSIFNFVYEFLMIIINSIMLFFLIISIYMGKLTLGTLTSATQIVNMSEGEIKQIIQNISVIKYNWLLLDKLIIFLEKESEAKEGTSINPLRQIDKIEAVDLNYLYGDKYALRNINFELCKGEKVAIVGRNGSGKSTLVKLLCGLYSPSNGKMLLINGKPITSFDKTTFHNKVSILFQNYVKYEGTIQENIGYGCISEIGNKDLLNDKIRKYSSFLSSLGLNKQLGNWFKDGTQLSGGQWQSVATTRAFLNDSSELIILDEPNSSLDPIKEKELFDNFSDFISKDKIGIFISHHIASVKYADKIIVIDDGTIIDSGKHDDLLSRCDVYKKLEKAETYGKYE